MQKENVGDSNNPQQAKIFPGSAEPETLHLHFNCDITFGDKIAGAHKGGCSLPCFLHQTPGSACGMTRFTKVDELCDTDGLLTSMRAFLAQWEETKVAVAKLAEEKAKLKAKEPQSQVSPRPQTPPDLTLTGSMPENHPGRIVAQVFQDNSSWVQEPPALSKIAA